MPLVSIIMPCHNSELYITPAIQSVILQTFTDWELLIIDDCSTDNSVKIISEYAKEDSRIKLLQTDKSFGKPFYPRNLGIQNAIGRYIAFLDSDDIWLPTKLEHQLPLFENQNAGIVFSYYQKLSSSGKESKNKTIKSPSKVTFNSALFGNPIGNLTGMYDSQKTGKIFFENINHEDYLFWLTILKKGLIAVNTNTLEAIYRNSNTSLSSNKIQAARWTWNIYRKSLNFNPIKSSFYFFVYMIKGFIKSLK